MTQPTSFIRTTILATGLLTLASCTGMDDTQQRVLSGGAAGAAIGTVGTVMTGGCVPCGAAIGGAAGAGTGYVLDQMDKKKSKSSSPSGGQ